MVSVVPPLFSQLGLLSVSCAWCLCCNGAWWIYVFIVLRANACMYIFFPVCMYVCVCVRVCACVLLVMNVCIVVVLHVLLSLFLISSFGIITYSPGEECTKFS